jgi:eukaryotic-like serine/threonine-protein kinase
MSPEQLRGKPLDARTDVYSLSLMTFEMLTGTLPFAGRTQQETMISRLRNEPIPLRLINPDLPEPVEHVLRKGMSRDADARYSTAPQFADALSLAAAGRRTHGSIFGRLFGR